jgi:hypothetical protein
MSAVETTRDFPWWREPTKDQWYAFVAAGLGWTLDAFDFTIFLLIMLPIADEFHVPLTDVTIVFTLTLWMRLVGATASGWVADRMGRKSPLMLLGYSLCNFIAGFSPTCWFLLLIRSRHRHRLLLSRRRNSRRDGAADPDLFRGYLGSGVRDPDADRNPVRVGQFYLVGSVRPGDEGTVMAAELSVA